ncbi:hypothetical protein [Pseudokineococcus sp. 1T1Z-3]|uniref:hypothetical protein n=1 Tax=Pseudokineococcus sp. 1T1Z-3 TaxID=3132745 RepID=UPI0030A9BF22
MLASGVTGVAASLLLAGAPPAAASAAPSAVAYRSVQRQRQAPTDAATGSSAIAAITPVGARITTLVVDVGVPLLACADLTRAVAVTVQGPDGTAPVPVARALTRDEPSPGEPAGGRYVLLELAGPPEQLPQPYRLVRGNTEPMLFREHAADGSIVTRPRVQATSTPVPLGEELVLTVELRTLVGADGAQVRERSRQVTGRSVREPELGQFDEGVLAGPQEGNTLAYRIRRPSRTSRPAPLVLFLHGSGQVGTDNLAHLLSSRGAVGALEHDDPYVLAPQLPSVFDPFDPYDEASGRGGGIHWQSANRRRLLAGLVRRVVEEETRVDRRRVYVVGLSRGAEGALGLVLDEPQLVAGAVLLSGREAGTVEWMSGRATPDLLRPATGTPLWFFHAVQDAVSPVEGTRVNVDLLRGLGHPSLRSTELGYEQRGDSGIVNDSAHNSWDLAFNSPDVWQWLLSQRRRTVR